MQSTVKYSEDVIPLTDLKVNPGRIVKQINKNHRPILLTSKGRGVVKGLMDLKGGHELSLANVKKRLGLS